MDKCILIIDDNDQSVNVKSLKLQIRCYCNLDVIAIKTTDSIFKEKDSEHLDINKLKQEIKNRIEGKSISFAFTDFNLSEKNINGLTVVGILKDFRPKLKVVMYSGNLETVIRSVVGISLKNANEEDIVNAVKKLMEYGIIDYIKRDDYVSRAIELIKKDQEPSVQDYFIQQLRNHKDLEFQSCYPRLVGKKFGEIADLIESSNDRRIDEWTSELIEQTIAYLVKIN